ncbi:MAG: type VII toxin-antitoxin system HepT family RNase toxin [Archaeoglobaceae archaeon]
MRIDRDLIKRRTLEIRKALGELRSLSSQGRDNLISDPNLIDAAKYKLLVAIEASLSICNHIAARLEKKIPESYSDCFIILGREEVISEELSERLANMAKFRNMLVHIYWEIDDEMIFNIIKENLEDLEEFLEAVNRL